MFFSLCYFFFFSSFIQSNLLYEIFPISNGSYKVETLSFNLTKPSGIELGYYKEQRGLFISSFSYYCIYFYTFSNLKFNLIAGIPYNSGNNNGQMLFSTFNSPSRMIYDSLRNKLFITEKQSGIIRILDFLSDQVKNLYYYNPLNQQQIEILQFERSIQTGGDFPGLDIQLSNNILYIVDTIKLYSINSIVLINGQDVATLNEYNGLSSYMNINGYPVSANLRSCIYSVTPDEKRKVLYVAISYAKNVILQVSLIFLDFCYFADLLISFFHASTFSQSLK